MTDLIYVMRHGESAVNVKRIIKCRELDGDLTPDGQAQARSAGAWLADKGIQRIRHSPMHRAVQTAAIVGDALKLTPILDEQLREWDCGDLEGQSGDAAWEAWNVVHQQWRQHILDAACPGGETFGDALLRMTLALRDAQSTELLVTHGGIGICVIPYLCVNAAALQRIDYLSYTGIVVLERYDADRYICQSWNLVEHLS